MDKELKPCPFCGGDGRIIEKIKVYDSRDKRMCRCTTDFYVRCDRCGAEAEHFDNQNSAIKAWNRRVEDEN